MLSLYEHEKFYKIRAWLIHPYEEEQKLVCTNIQNALGLC